MPSDPEDPEVGTLLVEAELVRRLLTVATGQAALSDALDAVNLVLRTLGELAVIEILVADTDAAVALDADLPEGADNDALEAWQALVDRGEAPQPVAEPGAVLVPAVWNRSVVGMVRVAHEGAADQPMLDALASGTGEGLGRASLVEQARRQRDTAASDRDRSAQ